jgi:hypothetical protein
MFQVEGWLSDLIISHLDHLKKDFVQVDEVMYQGSQRPCEQTFCILGIEKSDLDEVALVMFKVSLWP